MAFPTQQQVDMMAVPIQQQVDMMAIPTQEQADMMALPTHILSSNTLYNYRSFRVQLDGIPLMTLFLAILQPSTLVVLQHPMFPTVVSGAEPAVSYYPLCRIFAILEAAADLLGWHTTADGERDFNRGVWEDVQGGEGWVCGGGCEMAAGKGKADGTGRDGGAEGEKLAESTDCGSRGDSERNTLTGEELDEDVEGILRVRDGGI